MALVLRHIYNSLNYLSEYQDPRVQDYFLMKHPIQIVVVIGLYLMFTLKWGPRYMENRKAYDLKLIMMVYNLLQVAVNTWLFFYAYIQTYWSGRYQFTCQPINDFNDTSEFAMMVVNYCHLYFMIKVFDLLDTVFFVLRKKSSHLSFLHVYHHSGILLGSYICTKYVPGGHATLLGIINSFVHAVMYFYYFMSAYKPEIKKSTFWKKQITHIQMIQFAILIWHFGRPAIFASATCTYPRFWLWVAFLQNLFMLLLFGDFYLRAYVGRKPASEKVK